MALRMFDGRLCEVESGELKQCVIFYFQMFDMCSFLS